MVYHSRFLPGLQFELFPRSPRKSICSLLPQYAPVIARRRLRRRRGNPYSPTFPRPGITDSHVASLLGMTATFAIRNCHCESPAGSPPQTSEAFAVGKRRWNGMCEACRYAARWKSPKRRLWRIQRGGFEAGPRLSRPMGARSGWANDERIGSLRRRRGNPSSPPRKKKERLGAHFARKLL